MTRCPHRNFLALIFVISGIGGIFVPLTAHASPRVVRVAILCGQSNMAGGSGMVARTDWPQVWFDDSTAAGAANSDWGGLRPVEDGGTGVQAGIAPILQAAYPGDQIAILKVAQSATGIPYWAVPGNTGYEALTSRITAARQRLEAQKQNNEILDYEFVGFFYMQGENEIDAWNTDHTRRYFEYFHRIVSTVRQLAGEEEMPVVVGRTGHGFAPSTLRPDFGNLREFPATGSIPYGADSEFINSAIKRGRALYEGFSDSVRSAQMGWMLYDPHSAWVDVDDFPLTDYFHFTDSTPGKITLGQRMGRSLQRILNQPTADELVLDVGPHRWVHPGQHTLTATVLGGPTSPSSVQWTTVAGAATVDAPGSLTTIVTLSDPGVYAFQVTAAEGELRHAQTAQIYVLPEGENLPAYGRTPVFHAPRPGAPVTLVPQIINPDADPLSFAWSQQSTSDPRKRFGQGQMIIDSPTAANPTVRFTWPGVQIVRLQINDGTVRADGNASGWMNVPVFVGADGVAFPDYSARWSFEEAGYLLPEMNEVKPEPLNVGVVQSAAAVIGDGSAVFDGASYLRNHIGHWDSSVLFLRPFTNYSLAMWVKVDAPSSGTQVLYEEGGRTQDSAFTLRFHEGNLQAGIFENGTLHTVSTPAPGAGEWTHVACIFSGSTGTLTLWVNGIEAATTGGLPAGISKRSLASAIGARLQQDAFNATGGANDAADFFQGNLDEIRLYERALGSEEIAGLYQAGAAANPGGVLSMAASTQSVAENAGSVTVLVRRTVAAAGAASVDFTTVDGTATAGADFTQTSGTLTWADGESNPKTIVIPVINNALSDGNLAFSVALSNPQGGALSSPTGTTITILDDEPINQAPVISVLTPTAVTSHVVSDGTLFLRTTVTDDALTGQALTLAWSAPSGPTGVVFSAPASQVTLVTFSADGEYTLRLTASDGVLSTVRDFPVVVGGTPGGSQAPTEGLILHYQFDEGSGTNIADAAGNHSLSGFANASWVEDGQRNSAYAVKGVSGRAFEVPNAQDLNFNPQGNEFTVSAWVRNSDTSATYRGIFDKTSGSTAQYRLEISNSSTNLTAYAGNAARTLAVPTLANGSWHLVTLTNFQREGTWYFRVSVNDGQSFEEWSTGASGVGDGILRVGGRSTGSNRWSGDIDDFRIYNRALSAAQIAALYAGDAKNFAPRVSIDPVSGATADSPFSLTGVVQDDDLPDAQTGTAVLWELVSGPGTFEFTHPQAAQTSATVSAPGTYVFRLSANDGEVSGAAQVSVVVAGDGFSQWVNAQDWQGRSSAWDADPDGDGLNNFGEYAFDGNPLVAQTASLPVLGLAESGEALHLQITFLRARSGVVFEVESSSDLDSWQSVEFTPVAVGEWQTVTDSLDLRHHQRRFLRVRVSAE